MRQMHASSRRGAGALALVVALLAGQANAGAQDYSVVDLGTLGGPISGGFGLNDFGQVVGFSALPSADFHGFSYDGALTEVPPLAGQLQSHAFDVNAVGQVVAASYDLGEMHSHGLMWQSGTSTSLGNIAPRGANDAGAVVGYVSTMEAEFGWVDHAGLWQAGTLYDLGTLGGHNSYGYALDDSLRVVGMSFDVSGTPRATLWLAGIAYDLGTLGGAKSQAYGVNDAGDVVGIADTAAGSSHAFLFTVDGAGNVTSRTDLGVLGNDNASAYAVNTSGTVVGTSDDRAFIWEGGVLTDLNTRIPASSGWELRTAWAINDQGQIAGSGLHDGQPRAFLLTPACYGDLTGDNIVDLADLAQLLGNYGTTSGATYADGDLDGDGDVDLLDLAEMLGLYGTAC